MNRKNIFWGLLLIIVGVLFLGRNMEWWDFSLFFRGWWTLFLIIPSLIGLIKRESIGCSFLVLILGILMLLASQDIIEWSIIWKIFVPLIIIVVGLSIIFGNKRVRSVRANAKEYVAVCVRGVELDLRDVDLKNDLVIDCFCLFGGIDIRLPKDVKLEISGFPVFGGVENKYHSNKDSKVTVYVNQMTIFGGIDLL